MGNLYCDLGLPSRASERQIKATYRELAKRWHPDVNAGDQAVGQRIKDINRAYEVLGDAELRAAYDGVLARERAHARRRFWRSAATGAATFVVTAGVGLVATLLWQHTPAPPSQTRTMTGPDKRPAVPSLAVAAKEGSPDDPTADDALRSDAATASMKKVEHKTPSTVALGSPIDTAQPATESPVLAQEAPSRIQVASTGLPETPAEVSGAPPEQPSSQGERARDLAVVTAPVAMPASVSAPASWTTYRSARFGFGLSYPAEVFAVADGEIDERTLVSRDGRALLRITAAPNIAGTTLANYRRALMEARYPDATFDYAPQRNFWFVLSGTRGEKMFYERITLSCDRKSIHGWQLIYPTTERVFYDPIIEAVHRSYLHGNGPGARCGEAKSKTARPLRPKAASAAPAAATVRAGIQGDQLDYPLDSSWTLHSQFPRLS
jgi:DnaJ domain